MDNTRIYYFNNRDYSIKVNRGDSLVEIGGDLTGAARRKWYSRWYMKIQKLAIAVGFDPAGNTGYRVRSKLV